MQAVRARLELRVRAVGGEEGGERSCEVRGTWRGGPRGTTGWAAHTMAMPRTHLACAMTLPVPRLYAHAYAYAYA